MKLPGGCGEKSKTTAKSERAIYGLKQSGHKRSHLFADTLIADGFEQCNAHPCVFRNIIDEDAVMIISVCVDDLVVGGSQKGCESLLLSLNRIFPTNGLGECTWYDGCGIERNADSDTTKLSQEACVESLMTRFDIRITFDTPASPGAELRPKRGDESGRDWPVRETVGSLLWLSIMTRPDTTNAVRAVAYYAHTPTQRLWQVIMEILSRLNRTKSFGITFILRSVLGLDVCADTYYPDKANEGRSVSGIAVTWVVLL